MGIVLHGGTIITATKTFIADLRIEGEKIVSIGLNLIKNEDEVIDVSGKLIMPGGIDTHTHFDLDVGSTVTADNFYTGTKAAIIGGTTTILDYATQNKGETLSEALKNQFEKVVNGCFCDYGFHMGITDWNDVTSKEMDIMVEKGVTSFKLYMAYKQTLQVDDGVIYQALKRSKACGGLIGFHCENGDVIDVLVKEAKENGNTSPLYHPLTRPKELESEAINRLLTIAKLVDTPVYVVHLSSKDGLDVINLAKKEGTKVYVETCPQYLLLNDRFYENDFEGAKYVMSPPLRKEGDQEALWQALRISEIDTIGTDHCSFNFKGQKEIGKNDFSRIPNGAPGVEHRMSLLYTYGVLENKLSLNQMVALTSTNAAKLFGLYPRKGTIEVGSDADLIIWDPNGGGIIEASKQTQNVDYTPYEGMKQKGKIEHVFLRGNHLIMNALWKNEYPLGIYLHRKTNKGGEV